MSEFLGVKNVVDAQPILGKDGCADGFKIVYVEDRKLSNGMTRQVHREKTVWVREYVPENDGMIHGFGNPTVYLRTKGKKKEAVASKKKTFTLTSEGKAYLNKILDSKKAGK